MEGMALSVALPMITAASRCGLLSGGGGGGYEVQGGQEVVLGAGADEVSLHVIDETQFVTPGGAGGGGGGDMDVRASLIRCLRIAVEEWWAEENASEGGGGGGVKLIHRRAGVIGSVGVDGSISYAAFSSASEPVLGGGRGRVLADVMTV